MFCGNCGKENKNGMKFCSGCGKELEKIEPNKLVKEQPERKKTGKGMISVLIILGVIVLVILLCVLLGNKDSDSKDSGKSKSKVEKETDKNSDTNTGIDYDEGDGGLSVLEQIVLPTCKDGVVNKQGNSFNNLSYQSAVYSYERPRFSGRVTAQGDSVYYYKMGKLYRMDGNGNTTEICSASYASCLNVIGDTLYYMLGGDIYSVDVAGGESKVVLYNVIGPFVVMGESIYYVNCENATGTTHNFYVNKYSPNNKIDMAKRIEAGTSMPTLISVNPENNDEVIYFYQQKNQSYPQYESNSQPFDVVVADFDGKREVYSYENYYRLSNPNGYAMLTDEYMYFTQVNKWDCDFVMHKVKKDTFETQGYGEELRQGYYKISTPRSCYEDELIFGVVDSNGYGLYRVPFDWIGSIKDNKSLLKESLIITEQEVIREVYVLGEYIYYTLGSYAEAKLYRVKMDGTGWEELK